MLSPAQQYCKKVSELQFSVVRLLFGTSDAHEQHSLSVHCPLQMTFSPKSVHDRRMFDLTEINHSVTVNKMATVINERG